MFIAAIRLELSIPESGSLKSKRMVLKSLMDKVRTRFGAAVAEVGDQDLWQRAAVGIALVSGEEGHVRDMAAKAIGFVESHWEGEVLSIDTEIL
ncbi:MAG TPA: DUF503 domain-containing protein [Symbiobacteriaceae bacterium]|jgi:uncharacterized protein|nr:DUF503 domain-containing protein [Symbiobacteriaceae bacterium]